MNQEQITYNEFSQKYLLHRCAGAGVLFHRTNLTGELEFLLRICPEYYFKERAGVLGGGRIGGETDAKAAVRECSEETNGVISKEQLEPLLLKSDIKKVLINSRYTMFVVDAENFPIDI